MLFDPLQVAVSEMEGVLCAAGQTLRFDDPTSGRR